MARPLRPWMQLRSLGSSALNLRVHHLSTGVHAPFAPSALPRHSLASVARPGFPCGSPSRSFPFLRFFAPPAAMSCIFHALLPIATRSSCSQLANIAAGCLLYGTSGTSRVLSPSLRPCINTSQACSILAPLMGFCLQRSVHVLSRTPFGSPCPAFPWPRRQPLGHLPFGSQVSRPLLRLFSFAGGLPALASDRSTARLCWP